MCSPGTSISVTGTLQITQLANGGGVDPTWACTLDNVPIPTGGDPNFQYPENNWSLCDEPTLLPGNHTLKIRVTTKGQPFYVDSIQYTPTPDVSIDGSVLQYEMGDPAVSYGPGWSFYTAEDTQNITQTNGAQAMFSFHGMFRRRVHFLSGAIPSAEYSLTRRHELNRNGLRPAGAPAQRDYRKVRPEPVCL
jgi:hypothetical protein